MSGTMITKHPVFVDPCVMLQIIISADILRYLRQSILLDFILMKCIQKRHDGSQVLGTRNHLRCIKYQSLSTGILLCYVWLWSLSLVLGRSEMKVFKGNVLSTVKPTYNRSPRDMNFFLPDFHVRQILICR